MFTYLLTYLLPQKRGCLLGTGTAGWRGGGGGGGRGRESEGSTADTARKKRRDLGPPPEHWKCQESPRHCAATSALRNCCFNCRAGPAPRLLLFNSTGDTRCFTPSQPLWLYQGQPTLHTRSEPVWPSGKALLWLVSIATSVRICFGSPFTSKIVVCGHCLVTLSSQFMKH